MIAKKEKGMMTCRHCGNRCASEEMAQDKRGRSTQKCIDCSQKKSCTRCNLVQPRSHFGTTKTGKAKAACLTCSGVYIAEVVNLEIEMWKSTMLQPVSGLRYHESTAVRFV